MRGIHRWLVNSPHKGPVTRKIFPFDVITQCFQNDNFSRWKIVSLWHFFISVWRLDSPSSSRVGARVYRRNTVLPIRPLRQCHRVTKPWGKAIFTLHCLGEVVHNSSKCSTCLVSYSYMNYINIIYEICVLNISVPYLWLVKLRVIQYQLFHFIYPPFLPKIPLLWIAYK